MTAFSILIANGPNLDLLGKREISIYGNFSLHSIHKTLAWEAERMEKWLNISLQLEFFQTNIEGEMLNKLSEKNWSGIIINPAAWTHTSLALSDRLAGLSIPFIEVHLSNLSKREEFRHKSFTAPHAKGVIYGLGELSYQAALYAMSVYLLNLQKT